MKKAILALEDGRAFEGIAFGADGEAYGEVVFNTSMFGYQEILSDPSYKGQIVTMTYPLIGNYGANDEDLESSGPQVEGFVVKELSRIASNWRSGYSLEDFLKKANIIGIQGVDTRALTRHIRTHGAKKGVLSTLDSDIDTLVKKAAASPGLVGRDLVKEVTCSSVMTGEEFSGMKMPSGMEQERHVVAIDCGMKRNIVRMLMREGCRVSVVPAGTGAEDIIALNPDGLFLSNGPGDPEGVPYVIESVRALIGRVPVFGICLGHQILGLALGGQTYKLKFGHRGANHPVMDLLTGKVEITAQNHGFAVNIDALKERVPDIELTHINLNDKTVEGMRHTSLPVFSVQYHPEASPGPHDAGHLFRRFTELMETQKGKAASTHA